MRASSRTRNLQLVKHTLVATVLVVLLGGTAGWASSQPLAEPPTIPFDTSKDIAQSRALGYDVPTPTDTVMVGSAVAVTLVEDRQLPDGVRDYKNGQCTDFVAHYIHDKYGNTAYFFPGRKDPRNGRDFRRHHLALGGKEGTEPVLDAVVQTTESRYGHVAVVTALHVDGSFTVTEQNYEGRGVIGTRVLQRSDPKIVTFLYIDEVAPPAPPAPVVEERTTAPADEYTLPASAIAAPGAKPVHFTGRFQQVPAELAPIYEEAARTYQFPVRYLAADGSYETHFNARKIGDNGRSCGIHQFFANSARVKWPQNWGFASLEDCLDPRQNIFKVAEAWSTWRAKKCDGDVRCAINLHNSGSSTYARNVMQGADAYYR